MIPLYQHPIRTHQSQSRARNRRIAITAFYQLRGNWVMEDYVSYPLNGPNNFFGDRERREKEKKKKIKRSITN